MQSFWVCLVSLFFAVDGFGILPMFLSLTEGLDEKLRRRIIFQSMLTAAAVALFFIIAGQLVFQYLGITTHDFMIAGGVLLFIISLNDLMNTRKRQRNVEADSLGAVPLGVPLVVGPAVLTTSLILVNQYGIIIPTLALVLNILFACVLFWFSGVIIRLLGKAGTKIISKVASLILASIAVMMVRRGIQEIIRLL